MNLANMSKCLKCAGNDDIITMKVAGHIILWLVAARVMLLFLVQGSKAFLACEMPRMVLIVCTMHKGI